MAGTKWTPARRRKFKATMKAKRAMHVDGAPARRDRGSKDVNPAIGAIAFLEMAEQAIFKQAGETRRGRRFRLSDNYAMMALATLRGEV